MASEVRHEYRELQEEPQRDTSGAFLPPEVGCEPGVSELGTHMRVFSRVYDPSLPACLSWGEGVWSMGLLQMGRQWN